MSTTVAGLSTTLSSMNEKTQAVPVTVIESGYNDPIEYDIVGYTTVYGLDGVPEKFVIRVSELTSSQEGDSA